LRGFRIHRRRLPARQHAWAASPAVNHRPGAVNAAAADRGNCPSAAGDRPARNRPGGRGSRDGADDRANRSARGDRADHRCHNPTHDRTLDHGAGDRTADHVASGSGDRAQFVASNGSSGACHPAGDPDNRSHRRGGFTRDSPGIAHNGADDEGVASNHFQVACSNRACNSIRLGVNRAVISNNQPVK